jgi:hypothetical protein
VRVKDRYRRLIEPAPPSLTKTQRFGSIAGAAIGAAADQGVAGADRGARIDIKTSVPLMLLNPWGTPSGTTMKSPLATARDEPPSMPLPLRFSGFVRVSPVSLPPIIRDSHCTAQA